MALFSLLTLLLATAAPVVASPAAAIQFTSPLKAKRSRSPVGPTKISPTSQPVSLRDSRTSLKPLVSKNPDAGYRVHLFLRASRPAPITLLNELGRLARPVSPSELAAWKSELHHGNLSADSAAKLHVWLGEYELAANEQPETAIWHFGQVSSHAPARLRGLAKYDTALASYYEGAYADAQQSFKRLLSLKTGLPGYSIKSCALWVRMAGACAGYHAQRAEMGIPEPTRLDPYCGAAALAECLRAMGRPYSKAILTSACRITGEGSSLQDLVDAGKRLGVVVRSVTANDAGLMALPKPVIAHVERDHFIVVTRADKKGVTYLCSDCGPWPGGEVTLTWNQWHMLDPDIYGAVTEKGTRSEDFMAAVLQGKRPPALTAGLGPLKGVLPALQAGALIRVSVIGNGWPACDAQPDGPVCPSFICGPMDGGGPGGNNGSPGSKTDPYVPASAGGASSGDPVDLATGGEEYSPDADLTVYNPVGPSVSFRRTYVSLSNYGTNEIGLGWSDSFNVQFTGPGGYFGIGVDYLVMPNGSMVSMNVPSTPTAANPRVICPMQPGAPMLAEWDYDGATSGDILITFPDRSQWRADSFGVQDYPLFRLTQMRDKNGNTLYFGYDRSSGLLTTITNSASTVLLTLGYTSLNGGGTLTSISDAYGRSVYYQTAPYGYPGYTELTQVSQIVATGTINPPLRYTYDYQLLSAPGGESVPFLHTITVPSPTGAGNSTATINNGSSGYVSSLVDANGYSRSYYSAGVSGTTPFLDYNHTTVTVTNPQAQTVYSYTAGYDNNMSGTTTSDGAGTIVETRVYGDPNDPYRPSQVMDGIASNLDPAITQGSAVTFNATGTDAPATGTWDIVLNHTIVAASGAPNGWSVSIVTGYGKKSFTVGAPTNALVANGYEVRDNTPIYGHPVYYSGIFDVIAPGTIRQGTTYYTWDQYGNMVTGTSPRGKVTTNTWSYTNFALGELTQTQTGTKSPTSYTYWEPSGNVHTGTSPLPGTVGGAQTVTTTYTYSALGNLTSVVAPGNNSATTITTSFGYTTDGNYNQAEALGEPLTVTDNLGHVSHYRYDSRSNRTVDIDPLGNEFDTTFNLADDWVTLTHPATGETGAGHAATTNTYLYTGGPLTEVTYFDESGTQVRQDTFTYGPEGVMLTRSGQQEPFTYGYDALYRPVTLSDGNSHATAVSYNTAGYLDSVTWPGGQSSQFEQFDANGEVLKRVDGNNVETDYVYNDPESRLTDIEYPASPSLNVHFVYDSYGRRTQMTDATGVRSWTYDDNNGVLTDQTTYAGVPAQTIGYSFYPNGSCSSMTTPAGTFSYDFDGDGRLNSLTNPFSETSQWSYLDNNWPASQTLADGAVSYFTYNSRGFMTRLQNETSGMATLSDFGEAAGMQYDSLGNRLTMPVNIPVSSPGSGTTSFSFNPQNEITQEQSTRNGGYTNSFGYDAAFNPTTFRGATNTFNTNNQDNSLTFDGNGSPTDYNGVTTTYDPEGRMTGYGSLLTAGYDGLNLRAWKQNSAGRTYYLYAGRVPIIEMNGSGTITAVNTFGAEGLLSRHTTAASVFYTFDPSGNVVQRLDSSQTVLSTFVFDSFGKELAGGNTGEPWGFGARAGYQTDNETGLQLLTYRYYDPGRGRFLTRDPLGDGGGINQYAYVTNNPAEFGDPNGLFVVPPGWTPPGGTGTGTGVGEGAGAGAGEAGAAGEAGGITAGGVAAGGTIIAGGEAGYEIWNYNMNDPCHATGPFTWIGVQLGNLITGYCNQPGQPPQPPCNPKERKCINQLNARLAKCAKLPDKIDRELCEDLAWKKFRICIRKAQPK